MWEMAVVSFKTVIQEQISVTLEPEDIFDIKDFVVLFYKTMQSYSYNVTLLLDFTDNMKEAYADVSINRYNNQFVAVSDQYDNLFIFAIDIGC
jgi:hypothetical protein